MPFSAICRHVVLVGIDVSEKCIASNFREKTINELKTRFQLLLAVERCEELITILKTEQFNHHKDVEICSSETSVMRRFTRRNITKEGIPHSHCLRNFKSYEALNG
jgi:hypothetical protein